MISRVLAVAILAMGILVLGGSTARATIHPIVASFCAMVAFTNPNVLDPPGQTPASFNPAEWDRSDLRALQATGVLTIVQLPDGSFSFTFDPTHPAVKDFGFPAFGHCPALGSG